MAHTYEFVIAAVKDDDGADASPRGTDSFTASMGTEASCGGCAIEEARANAAVD
jgi:hypothetical protein